MRDVSNSEPWLSDPVPGLGAGGPFGLRTTLAVLAILLSPAREAHAIDLEKLVMPGPLAQAHEKYESDCASCHEAFNVTAQRRLCLACHEKLAADLEAGEGLHSRSPLAANGECRSCHAEHRGRDADIRGLSEATFDHQLTDYPLAGAHQSTPCEGCHLPEVARRDAPPDCVDCHREVDAHDGALSTDCGSCHDETSWKTNRFDHDKTEFRLIGKHQTASCVGCHVGARYKETPTDCVACHSIDDRHAGRFGDRCADCHTPASWLEKGFDHEKKSGFPLIGAHSRTDCITCHRQPPGKRKLPENCSECHSREDVHAGRFGAECGDCHRPAKWADFRFDHTQRTRFPLRESHREVSCESCHAGSAKLGKMDSSCIACHQSDDIHRRKLGPNCDECHNEKAFSGRIVFDHGLTAFPLLGLHAMVTCESCHSTHTFQHEDSACDTCHSTDDIHKGTLGLECQSCHNPNGWAVWQFDHERRTSFTLDGAHENLKCATCHRQPPTLGIQMPKSCDGCHSGDDAHRGGFGRNCDSCHTSKAWKPASFGPSGRGRQ